MCVCIYIYTEMLSWAVSCGFALKSFRRRTARTFRNSPEDISAWWQGFWTENHSPGFSSKGSPAAGRTWDTSLESETVGLLHLVGSNMAGKSTPNFFDDFPHEPICTGFSQSWVPAFFQLFTKKSRSSRHRFRQGAIACSRVGLQAKDGVSGGNGRGKQYRMVPPSDACWFINPINYSYICQKP